MTLVITTYDWVPEFPRGWVRDLRACWACEEAGLPYSIDTVPLRPKSPEHLARQPFGQIPMLKDGDVEVFESGAIVLHIAAKSPVLMPEDAKGRAEVASWAFAAMSSVEPVDMVRQMVTVFNKIPEARPMAIRNLQERLSQLETAFAQRQFAAAGRFTAADILLADVLRAAGNDGQLATHPRLSDYVDRMTARPAFQRVHAAQIARFAAADATQPA